MKILVTGTAGFIGYNLTKRLLSEGHEVVGVDNINDYYDVNLKLNRLKDLGIDVVSFESNNPKLVFKKLDISDRSAVQNLFKEYKFDVIVNLAAQAGVRYQFENANAYVESNLVGFVNIMEEVRNHPVKHFLYASSSSVYGLNNEEVFAETDSVDHPASLYAASKRANELIAHSYSNLFKIPTTGLRFFTVYGPWGRPDMFMYKLADSVTKGEEITIYEKEGKSLWRDYTYIDDIIEGIVRLIDHAPTSKTIEKPNISTAPYAIYNIGKGSPDENNEIISEIEKNFGKKVNLKLQEAPQTEIFRTFASTKALEDEIGHKAIVGVKEGISKFVEWYKKYHEESNIL